MINGYSEEKETWKKTLAGIFLSVVVLVVSQLLAQGIGVLLTKANTPSVLSIGISSVLYPVLTYNGLKMVITRMMKIPLEQLRIGRFRVNALGVVTAVLMPLCVVATFLVMPGEWLASDLTKSEMISTALTGILMYSIAGGIVEEMVFRGVIMGLLERKTNIRIAILLPSILFGLLHIIGNSLDVLSILQLVIAGTVVGILFSLIAYYSESIWSGAIVHAAWNVTTIGIMHIGTEPDNASVYTYVLESKERLITGGDFGIESSIVSIIAYTLFGILVLLAIKRNRDNFGFLEDNNEK